MIINYNEYQRKYDRENIVTVTIKLNKHNDKDIITFLSDLKNKNAEIKKILRENIS